jgi:hypothetical protein
MITAMPSAVLFEGSGPDASMTKYLLSVASPEFWSIWGFRMLLLGLAGDLAVIFIPQKRHILERALAIVFTLLVFAGVYVGHIGDDAISAALEKKFTPRTLDEKQRQHISANLKDEPPGAATIFSANPTFEAMHLADLIATAFVAANWKVDRTVEPDIGPIAGVGVAIFASRLTRFRAAILKSILEQEGITSYVLKAKRCASETDPKQAPFAPVDPSCNRMVIVVGDHP